jgi:hypothetical protein
MVDHKSFKSDISFLEKISMGATGVIAVIKDLKKQGHVPIELERGSTSFKIWKNIKIKRIRVPDILCIKCGKCVECRAKTKLEISMSHSQVNPERGWDYGLDDDDFVAFVVCEKVGSEPISWQSVKPIHYVSVGDLRQAQIANHVVLTKPKGPEEGSERRIIWPVAVANASGIVISVNQNQIKYQTRGRIVTMKLSKSVTLSPNFTTMGRPIRLRQTLKPLVRKGDKIVKNQIIASVVPVSFNFNCDKSVSQHYYIKLLKSASLSKRYVAAKALGYFTSPQALRCLHNKLNDVDEDIYVKLEAAASLARQKNSQGFDFIRNCLNNDEYLPHRLEAVIVLGEIHNTTSYKILKDTLLNKTQPPEIRAGAAWALGEMHYKSALDALIESLNIVEGNVRVEAARAIAKLARRFTSEILSRFPQVGEDKRPGIAWALSKGGKFNTIHEIMNLLTDEDARAWVAYIIGTQAQANYINEIEELKKKDPEVYFAVTVLWKIMTSWIWGLEEW